MRKFLVCLALVVLAAQPALAAIVNLRARQPFYGTEFDVYRTPDMPANWFKTYDGYYVSRRLDTNWVYGRMTPGGLAFTEILVGSVDPRTVAELGGATSIPAAASGQTPVYVPPVPAQAAMPAPTSIYNVPSPTLIPGATPVSQEGDLSDRVTSLVARHSAQRKTGKNKVSDPRYQKELKEIIKGLNVLHDSIPFSKVSSISMGPSLTDLRDYIVSTFKQRVTAGDTEQDESFMGNFAAWAARRTQNLRTITSTKRTPGFYDYWYPYLTSEHFSTKVPLDFHIIHERETGHVEFYVTIKSRGAFSNGDILFLFDYGGEREDDTDLTGKDFYLLRHLPFDKDGQGVYGLRLATTSRTWLPMPTYTTLMQKISSAKRVQIYSISAVSDRTHYDRKKTWKLLGIIELSAIDQRNRFVKSMEARYETYKKIVELEERWQGPFSSEPERPFSVSLASTAPSRPWESGEILEADEIYNLLTDGHNDNRVVNMLSELTRLFGNPQITELRDTLSNLFVARMTWESRGNVRVDADYEFQGGQWNANHWVPESKGTWKMGRLRIVEHREDAEQAFASRVQEFTEMLGRPKLKQSSRATWLIGDYDELKFAIYRGEDFLSFAVEDKVTITPTRESDNRFWPEIVEPVK